MCSEIFLFHDSEEVEMRRQRWSFVCRDDFIRGVQLLVNCEYRIGFIMEHNISSLRIMLEYEICLSDLCPICIGQCMHSWTYKDYINNVIMFSNIYRYEINCIYWQCLPGILTSTIKHVSAWNALVGGPWTGITHCDVFMCFLIN